MGDIETFPVLCGRWSPFPLAERRTPNAERRTPNADAVDDAAERKPAASETSVRTGDSVRITSMRLDAPTPSAAFEVTKYEDEVYTYGITFEFLTQATEESQVAATVRRTIPSVSPARL